MISDLMDGAEFHVMAADKHGSQINGGVRVHDKSLSLNLDEKENRLKLPPFRGKHFHEIFGDPDGCGNYILRRH